jgi:hypothetical protein
MVGMGRFLIVFGILLIALGLLLTYSNLFSFLRLGRLPGDIVIRKPNFQFYFPITTSILLSLLLTLILYLFRK